MSRPLAALRSAFILLSFAASLAACTKRAPPLDPLLAPALSALDAAAGDLGAGNAASIRARITSKTAGFIGLLETVLAERALDPERFLRADKVAPPLPATFEPRDLASADGRGIHVSQAGELLREAALGALVEMNKAALASSVDLELSSAYRSSSYQAKVFARIMASDGETEARRVSAEAGRSQHQLGTAMDFGSISDAFATTRESAWLKEHAGDWGFSLSYPEGLESVTGYRPESWHWRWLGVPAVKLQKQFFGDVQQYLIVYLSYYH